MNIEDFYQHILGLKQEEKQATIQEDNIMTVQQIKMKQEILQKLNSPAYLMLQAKQTNQSVDEIISNLNQQFEKYSHLQLVEIVQHPPVLEDRDSDYEDVEDQEEGDEQEEDLEEDDDEEEDDEEEVEGELYGNSDYQDGDLSYQDNSQLYDEIINNIQEDQELPQIADDDDDDDSNDILQ